MVKYIQSSVPIGCKAINIFYTCHCGLSSSFASALLPNFHHLPAISEKIPMHYVMHQICFANVEVINKILHRFIFLLQLLD